MEREKGFRNEKGARSEIDGFLIMIVTPAVMKGIEKSIFSNLSSDIVRSATIISVLLSTRSWTKVLYLGVLI